MVLLSGWRSGERHQAARVAGPGSFLLDQFSLLN
jgi:hypothetical protein